MNFRKSDLRKKHVGNLMDRKNRAGYLFIAPFLFGMLFILSLPCGMLSAFCIID